MISQDFFFFFFFGYVLFLNANFFPSDIGGDRRSNRIVMEASRRLSGDFTDWDREVN